MILDPALRDAIAFKYGIVVADTVLAMPEVQQLLALRDTVKYHRGRLESANDPSSCVNANARGYNQCLLDLRAVLP